MDFLTALNPQQREAVEHVEGPLLILAGAGSGKTRVITHRIAHLIRTRGIPGYQVLAVTFTNKAAGEMRDRVLNLARSQDPRPGPIVSTFHSFCVRLLRRDGDPLAAVRSNFTRNFTIYDEDDQLALMKAIFRHAGLDEKFMPYRSVLSRISHAKSQNQTPADLYSASTDPKSSRLASLFEMYEERLQQANALDFDDLLLEAVRLLRIDEPTRAAYNRRFGFLMIDEYQDTNRSQYDLMRLLTQAHQNICVVGDEDQSIYGWRGADIRNILDFERDFPNAKVIRLEQNYRSTKNILESASALVANNTARKGKWLWTQSGSGEPIGFYEAWDGENEALFIADTIEQMFSRNPAERIAVLYRTNAQSRQIEEALRRYGRKYLVIGGFSFYQRAEVKDLLAYLRASISPHDSIALLRIINTPARGIGRSTIEQLERFATEHNLSLWSAIGRMVEEKQLSTRAEAALSSFRRLLEELTEMAAQGAGDLLKAVIDRTGYMKMLEADSSPEAESRIANVNELLNAAVDAAERGETVTEFLDHAALVADADGLDEHAAVSLLTIHNAKGLEFPVVFMAGVEEGLFPHSRSVTSEAALEEERRLCYVGMTRAEKRLFLTWARSRRRWGGGQPEPCIPSRFLAEIPREFVQALHRSRRETPQVDLFVEQHEVRQSAKRNTYTGKTYNSLDNIAQYFTERGMTPPPVNRTTAPSVPAKTAQTAKPAAGRPGAGPAQGFRRGSIVYHPTYGRGQVVRLEGEGDDTKLTVSFRAGLKKIIAKYATLKTE